MNEEILRRAGEIISKNTALNRAPGSEPYCTLATIDIDGYPVASTITAAKSEGVEWITFDTGLESGKTKRIANNSRASVCFNAPDYNITLVGEIEICTDTDIKNEMWYSGMANHFTGADDPRYCVLRFRTKRYNLLVDWKEAEGEL